jgi:hypothetical protein
MNNKSDKKHKRKQKQKQKETKHKKKTASHKSKTKKEIKGGGAGWFKGLFSGNTGSYNSKTKISSNQQNWKNPKTLAELKNPLLSNSKRLENPQPANSRNPRQNVVSQTQPPANPNNSQQNVLPVNSKNSQPPPPPPPNAQPQGFNTLKAQSRCSIM